MSKNEHEHAAELVIEGHTVKIGISSWVYEKLKGKTVKLYLHPDEYAALSIDTDEEEQ